MNTNNVTRRFTSKLQMIVLTALVVMLVSSTLVKPAKAWMYSTPSNGRPGSVIVPNIYIGDLLMPWGGVSFTLYGATGPTVYRSPATTGLQQVGAQCFVEKYNGTGWVISAYCPALVGTIGAGQTSVRFVAPYIQPVLARGTFRVSWIFTWTSGRGANLGGITVRSSLKNDHICVTPHRLCQTFPGGFQTGGYETGTW